MKGADFSCCFGSHRINYADPRSSFYGIKSIDRNKEKRGRKYFFIISLLVFTSKKRLKL